MGEPVVGRVPDPDDAPRRTAPRPRWTAVVAGLVGLAVTGAVVTMVVGDGDGRDRADVRVAPSSTNASGPTIPEVPPERRLPDAPLAAACYSAEPTAEHLRSLFGALGGLDGLEVGVARGAFDVVSFDAFDHDRLLAAQRSGYGPAENQHVSERWSVSDVGIAQALWDPATPHDFVHYNADGTTSMWVHGGGDGGYAPRTAVVIGRDGRVVTTASAPMFADRFAVDGGTVFALVGNPDWYAPRDIGYVALVADDGQRQTRLASGATYGWIDIPTPGLLVAYPAGDDGVTAVWDTETRERLDDHPLAGRSVQRVAVSGDGSTAVAITLGGELEAIDLATGRSGDRFGRVDVTEVERPLVVNRDGSVTVTVEKSGRVSIWFVGDGEPVVAFEASSGLPRWLPTSRSAARLTSALSPDARRLALRLDATPQVGVTWRLIDIDVDSWLALAQAADTPGDPKPC